MTLSWLLTLSTIILTFGLFDRQDVRPQEPNVVRAVPAVYPTLAAVARASGTVIVEVTIKADGTVAKATAVEGHEVFVVAAERSAGQWVFNGIQDRDLIRTARITYPFQLVVGTTNPEDLVPVFLPPLGIEIRGAASRYIYDKNVDPSKSRKVP